VGSAAREEEEEEKRVGTPLTHSTSSLIMMMMSTVAATMTMATAPTPTMDGVKRCGAISKNKTKRARQSFYRTAPPMTDSSSSSLQWPVATPLLSTCRS